MTTALFLLRVYQAGLSIADLDELEAGTVFDIMTEAANDEVKYTPLADQEDFDRF